MSLSLAQPLFTVRSGVAERIYVQFHEQKWQDATRRLSASSLLSLSGDLKVSDVLGAYEEGGWLTRGRGVEAAVDPAPIELRPPQQHEPEVFESVPRRFVGLSTGEGRVRRGIL